MNNYFSNIKEIYDSVTDLLVKGLPEEALTHIENSSPEIRDYTIMTYLKGVCYQETGHYDKAEESFRRVIIQDPGFISAAEALLYMRDNHLSDGEKRYLAELISMGKYESETLKELRKSLTDTEPVMLSEFVPEEEPVIESDRELPSENNENEISLDDIHPEEPMAYDDFIFKPVSDHKPDQTPQEADKPEEEAAEPIDLTGKEGDLKELFDSLNAETAIEESVLKETGEKEFVEKGPEPDEPVTSIDDIHLSPEEEAELQREEDMDDGELLSDSEEADKLKDLLRTLHDRKQKDIESEDSETGSIEDDNDDVAGPFDTLTMAKVYLKQGAYASALRILKLLKKNTTESDKLNDIDLVMESVLEGLKTEKTEQQ